MLFKSELIEQIKLGNKIQTRRVVKHHEQLIGMMPGTRFYKCVAQTLTIDERVIPHRIKWQVGKSYAICPGRGKHGVGRIWIKNLSQQADVRTISLDDAKAEGFESIESFLTTWMHINDHSAQACWDEQKQRWIWYSARCWHHSDEGDNFAVYMASRPAERYNAWVIEFELEADGENT